MYVLVCPIICFKDIKCKHDMGTLLRLKVETLGNEDGEDSTARPLQCTYFAKSSEETRAESSI